MAHEFAFLFSSYPTLTLTKHAINNIRFVGVKVCAAGRSSAWTHTYTIIVHTLILYNLITLLHVSVISDHNQEESFEVTNVTDKVLIFIIQCVYK